MPGTSGNQFPPTYLTPSQQDLLMAALSSNDPNRKTPSSHNAFQGLPPHTDDNWGMNGQSASDGFGSLDFSPAELDLGMTGFDDPEEIFADGPFLDFLGDGETGLDSQQSGVDGQAFANQLDANGTENDIHDKRKVSDDQEEDKDENEPKRREPDEKVAKKPGRKPLTSEPTTKRKAQNRAAQRAFRERKEKHLRDLETKVSELEKASDAVNHENGLLKAQVERLQVELREYRRRLSLSTSTLGRTLPLSNGLSSYLANASNATGNNFQFEFPRFGSLPGGVVFNNGSLGKPTSPNAVQGTPSPLSNNGAATLARYDSKGEQQISPRSQSRTQTSLPSMVPPVKAGSGNSTENVSRSNSGVQVESIANDSLSGLFNSALLSGSANNSSATTINRSPEGSTPATSEAVHPQPRVFQFNSSNSTSTDSPSSSISQYGGNSSCCTSPEPSHNSPANLNKTLDTIDEQGSSWPSGPEGEVSFCDKLNMACGNARNPIPRAISMSQSNGGLATNSSIVSPLPENSFSQPTASNLSFKGIDYFAQQNGGQFDPMLFGDYRDSQAAIVGDGDFTGGFFNEALPPAAVDYSSPFNWDLGLPSTGLTPAVSKPNPLEQADLAQAGSDEEEVVPGEDTSRMLSCHKIWDKLQDNQDFKDGTLDIDSLCSELRAKARCSESGVVIDKKDVDAALKRTPAKRTNSQSANS